MPPFDTQVRQRQDSESRQLHDQDERLVDAALALLAKTLEAAPDGDEGAGECHRAAGDAAQEARQPVEQRMLPPHDDRPAEDHEGGVEYEQRADDVDVEDGPAMQQAIDAERQADGGAGHEGCEAAPGDVAAQRPHHQRLARDAADHHDLDDMHGIVEQVEQHGAANRREGEARDT